MYSLSGSPQEFNAGYNPNYFYFDSDNKNKPNFRYLFKVTKTGGDVLANLKIKPRYGDGLCETNISKVLTSRLGCFADDADFNDNTATTGFTNHTSGGYEYGIQAGEQYQYSWDFTDVVIHSGDVTLTGDTAPLYVAGDVINVQGAAEYFVFTDNQFDGGNVAFLIPTGHTIVVGNTVTIQQDSPYTFEQYNQDFTVTAVTATLVTVEYPYLGNTPIEGGMLIRNLPYDGTKIVSGVTGNQIFLHQGWIDNSPTHSGTTTYADGRDVIDDNLYANTYYTFNGAVGHSDWINWDGDAHDPSGSGQTLCTTLGENWKVRLENDVFISYWGKKQSGANAEMRVRTYDDAGAVNGEFIIDNPATLATQEQMLMMSV